MEKDNLRILGCVKWFNNKTGYGFITSMDERNKKDIFVHHSAIDVANPQYKYLVQGEYVSFELVKSSDLDSKHEYFAGNVSGVNGGKLMCETRNFTKPNPTTYSPKKKTSYRTPTSSRDYDYRPRPSSRDYDYRPRSSRPF